MITSPNGNIYIESQNIRVFPCAYRGYYQVTKETVKGEEKDKIETLVFDPEARATTEANFTNTFHKLSNNKESYVIAWIPNSVDEGSTGTLKCVIGGYYFEIYNHTIDNFFDPNSGAPYYLCIRTTNVDLGTAEIDASNARTTPILQSFYNEAEHYLDIKTNFGYAFTGLAVSKITDGSTASLAPFVVIDEYVPDMIADANNTGAQIGKYYADPTTKRIILIETEGDALTDGTQLYHKESIKTLDPSQLSVTNILDTGHGKYSIRMLEDTTLQGNNTTTATGNYSIALGKSTVAEGETSTALGDNTSAEGDGSFTVGILTEATGNAAVALNNQTKAFGDASTALGSNTTAKGQNSITGGNDTATTKNARNALALGDHTKATAENQVVIGAYNEEANQAFIIANGTETAKSNKFTVSYDGDVKALGNLEITNGNDTDISISAVGSKKNTLILGTTEKNSCGEIKVYGESDNTDPVFQVETTGNTTIAGVTKITNIAEATDYESGALQVAGGVSIAKDLYVKGTLTVNEDQDTDLKGALSVADEATFGSDVNITGVTTITGQLKVQDETQNNILSINIDSDKCVKIQGVTQILNETDNGALDVTGGVKVGKQLAVEGATSLHGDLQVSTDANTVEIGCPTVITNETEYSESLENGETTRHGALKVAGGTWIGKNLCVDKSTEIKDDTDYSSEMKGDPEVEVISAALKIGGGTYIRKKLRVDDDVILKSETEFNKDENDNITAALKVMGGTYIAQNLHVDGNTTFFNDTITITSAGVAIKPVDGEDKSINSTATTDGALVVTGGVGITQDVYIGGSENITGNLTIAGTNNNVNLLTIGSATGNSGKLEIYGTGQSTVFSVTNDGTINSKKDLTIAGNGTINGNLKVGTGNTTIEISNETGIKNLPTLEVIGQIDAAVFNATSDARLKTNIEDYTFEKSILDLPIKQFEYIKDKTHTKYVGCIAQDLQHICPDLVNESAEGMLSIQESKLIYALIQEVKKLQTRVEDLERR